MVYYSFQLYKKIVIIYLQRDKQPTIPKFGEWEDSDPSTGDGFTEKFDRVRKENKNAENGAVVKSQEDPNFAIVYTIPEKKKSPKVKRPLGKVTKLGI